MNSSIFDIITLSWSKDGIKVIVDISRPKHSGKFNHSSRDRRKYELAFVANTDLINHGPFVTISDVFIYLNTKWPM